MARKTTPKNARWGVKLTDREVRNLLLEALEDALDALAHPDASHYAQAHAAYTQLAGLFRARSVTSHKETVK